MPIPIPPWGQGNGALFSLWLGQSGAFHEGHQGPGVIRIEALPRLGGPIGQLRSFWFHAQGRPAARGGDRRFRRSAEKARKGFLRRFRGRRGLGLSSLGERALSLGHSPFGPPRKLVRIHQLLENKWCASRSGPSLRRARPWLVLGLGVIFPGN